MSPLRSIVVAALLASAPGACGATGAQHSERPRPAATVSYPRAYRPLVDILGVLRRPQVAADLDDGALQRQLRFMSRRPAVAGRPVVGLIRFATVAPWGEKVFLVPARLLSREEIAKLPPDQRAIVTPRRGDALTLSGPATVGATAAQIKAGRDWGTARSDQLVIVVPDGVAKVTVWPGRTRRNGPPTPVTATVDDNIAAFQSRQNLDGPQRELWYGPSGKVIKRIARP